MAARAQRNGRGPGMRMGIVLGTLAGAAAAALLVRTGVGAVTEEAPPEGGVLGLLASVRSRLNHAAREGREAAREREAELQSRYDELTRP